MKKPEYTKWKVALDLLSLIFLSIFIGVVAYDPSGKIRYPNGDLTLYGMTISVVIIPSLVGGLWLIFRYIGSDLLLFRLLDKLHAPLSMFVILMIILLSIITLKG